MQSATGLCVDGYCCNTACNGLCESCRLGGLLGTCSPVPRGQDLDNECAGALTCAGANNLCLLAQAANCTASTQCQSNYCADGLCCDSVCTSLCESCNRVPGFCLALPPNTVSPTDCGTEYCNVFSQCTKALGLSCTADTDCSSGYCTDGVCCASRCRGLCEQCASGTGQCDPIGPGLDPSNECAGAAGVCTGNRSCTSLQPG